MAAVWVSLVSGAASGAVSTLLLQPLDVAKTRLISPSNRGRGMLQLFRGIVQDEGALRLWRGLDAALLRIALGSGCYFATQTALLSRLRSRPERPSGAPLSSTEVMAVGAVSRGAAVALCCPVSVVKTRMEGTAGRPPYRSPLQGLTSILQLEGARGLYAGLVPSLLKDCPYAALYLLLYARTKAALAALAAPDRLYGQTPLTHFAAGRPTATPPWPPLPLSHRPDRAGCAGVLLLLLWFALCSAFLAASAATTLFQPLEVIKTRLQLPDATPPSQAPDAARALSSSPFQRSTALLPAIYREVGLRGFFAGLLPRLIRRSLSNAIAWSLFEQLYSRRMHSAAV